MTEAKIIADGTNGFSVSGDMTFATTRNLLKESKTLFQQARKLKLDLSAVERADSAGLALLLEWVSQAEKKGGEVSIDRIPDSILSIAKLCQLEPTLQSITDKKTGLSKDNT